MTLPAAKKEGQTDRRESFAAIPEVLEQIPDDHLKPWYSQRSTLVPILAV